MDRLATREKKTLGLMGDSLGAIAVFAAAEHHSEAISCIYSLDAGFAPLIAPVSEQLRQSFQAGLKMLDPSQHVVAVRAGRFDILAWSTFIQWEVVFPLRRLGFPDNIFRRLPTTHVALASLPFDTYIGKGEFNEKVRSNEQLHFFAAWSHLA